MSQFSNNITVMWETEFQINILKLYNYVHYNIKTKVNVTYIESRKLSKNNQIKYPMIKELKKINTLNNKTVNVYW